jgi:VanZ family protein
MPDLQKDNSHESSIQRAVWLKLSNLRSGRTITIVFFVIILAGTLTAGLWPFDSPRNDVTWEQGESGLFFGKHGTAFANMEMSFDEANSGPFTLELWVKPTEIWTTGTIFASYDSRTRHQFTVTQNYMDLVLRVEDGMNSGPGGDSELRLYDVFRGPAVLVSIVSDGKAVSIYVDGVRKSQSQEFPLSGRDFEGRLILANSALRDRSWSGTVRGMAIYGCDLNSAAIQQHVGDWIHKGEPVSASFENLVALYLFRERSGEVIHNAAAGGVDLRIPTSFTVVDQLRFESPVSELHDQGNYLKNALLNVVGFIPLGFVAALFVAVVWKTERTTIAATVVGALTSLTIEYFQSYLPTRYSGVTDLITNTVGTLLGAILYGAAMKMLAGTIRAQHSAVQGE